jgi:hypothetical protein
MSSKNSLTYCSDVYFLKTKTVTDSTASKYLLGIMSKEVSRPTILSYFESELSEIISIKLILANLKPLVWRRPTFDRDSDYRRRTSSGRLEPSPRPASPDYPRTKTSVCHFMLPHEALQKNACLVTGQAWALLDFTSLPAGRQVCSEWGPSELLHSARRFRRRSREAV